MLRAVASEILSGTWANKPSSAAQGSLYFASDVGEHGTMFQYGVSRWRAFNGVASLKTLTAATSNIANSETIVLQAALPAGLIVAGDMLRVWLTTTKSGTTDGCNMTVRAGTAGTTGDTAITGANGYSLMATTGLTGGGIFDFQFAATNSVKRLGPSSSGNSTYNTPSNAGSINAATAVTDNATNALYLSVALASSGATNTVIAVSGAIQLITP